MWEAIDRADSPVIDLLHRVVDSASAIIGESRVNREESVVRSGWSGAVRRIDCRCRSRGWATGNRFVRAARKLFPTALRTWALWQWQLRLRCKGRRAAERGGSGPFGGARRRGA
jgi:hypothetical protein